jgi:hypothetical protein
MEKCFKSINQIREKELNSNRIVDFDTSRMVGYPKERNLMNTLSMIKIRANAYEIHLLQ